MLTNVIYARIWQLSELLIVFSGMILTVIESVKKWNWLLDITGDRFPVFHIVWQRSIKINSYCQFGINTSWLTTVGIHCKLCRGLSGIPLGPSDTVPAFAQTTVPYTVTRMFHSRLWPVLRSFVSSGKPLPTDESKRGAGTLFYGGLQSPRRIPILVLWYFIRTSSEQKPNRYVKP